MKIVMILLFVVLTSILISGCLQEDVPSKSLPSNDLQKEAPELMPSEEIL